MKNHFRVINEMRAMHLAKIKNEPFVPFQNQDVFAWTFESLERLPVFNLQIYNPPRWNLVASTVVDKRDGASLNRLKSLVTNDHPDSGIAVCDLRANDWVRVLLYARR